MLACPAVAQYPSTVLSIWLGDAPASAWSGWEQIGGAPRTEPSGSAASRERGRWFSASASCLGSRTAATVRTCRGDRRTTVHRDLANDSTDRKPTHLRD